MGSDWSNGCEGSGSGWVEGGKRRRRGEERGSISVCPSEALTDDEVYECIW